MKNRLHCSPTVAVDLLRSPQESRVDGRLAVGDHRLGHMRLAAGEKTVHAGNKTLRRRAVGRPSTPRDVLNGSLVATGRTLITVSPEVRWTCGARGRGAVRRRNPIDRRR